ncbi:YdbC family protein [Peribacillus asahii]|uniref:YdbC family protein n=1 Tax=Peribacillus asahii TaxID=228899 RepID=UPI003F4B538D
MMNKETEQTLIREVKRGYTPQKQKSNWEIVDELVLLEENENGWKKELNLVSWYGEEPKYDIRWWSSDRKKCMKGVTFSKEDMLKLYTFIGSRNKILSMELSKETSLFLKNEEEVHC